jgi:exosortase H (IPTLxxWG-CTERM-specific)
VGAFPLDPPYVPWLLSSKNLERGRNLKAAEAEKGRGVSIHRFVITYIVLMGLFLLAISLKGIKEMVDINGLYTGLIVYLSGLALEPFGIVHSVQSSIIHLKGLSLDVKFGCNGLEAFLIYTVAVLAFPARTAKKVVGIVAGFLILQVLNVVRIAALGLSGIYLKDYFHYIHIYVAQGIMIVLALVIFLLWLNYALEK